jgi:hypothetical protein
VNRLIRLSQNLPRKRVPLSRIQELNQPWSGDDEHQSWRAMIEHIHLIEEADLSFPIILSAGGAVMDGMHRIAKAVLKGLQEIDVVQFEQDPEPDYVGLKPEQLPY